MNVNVSWPAPGELSFAFHTDSADAVVPLPVVWFRCDGASKVEPLRAALMAYMMAKPFVGNSFTISGHPLAAHLAAKFHQDFEAHEFFVGPVSNIPQKILPTFQYSTVDVCPDGWSRPSTAVLLTCRRVELGYVFHKVDEEAPLLSIATNVDFFSAFTERPALLSLTLIYLCAYDLLGVKSIRIFSAPDAQWLHRANALLAEVGGGACFEAGGCAS